LVVEADRAIDGEVFHLADDHRPRSVDVMRACLNEAGYRGDIRFEPPKQYELIGTWFDQNEFITSAKARRVLGWAPRHPGVIEGIPAAYRAWCAARTTRTAGPVHA
jgi:nucleoside-diphosphate-sugar epimerase